MAFTKELLRRRPMFGLLGLGVAVTLGVGCGEVAEDPATFSPTVDTSQAAKSSDAPLATNKDVDPVTAGVKAANNKSDARPSKRVILP